MSIIDNYKLIQENIASTAAAVNRDPSAIAIIAVSKTFPSAIMQQAIDSGIHVFGENKIQEAGKKTEELTGEYSLHMIGHLQSNKAKEAVAYFDVIHSIDKVSTAVKVAKEAEKIQKVQNILVQVNASGESTKSGISPAETLPFFEEILKLQNINILGLMTMAPYTTDIKVIRDTFRKTRESLAAINTEFNLNLKELSMGMSSDYHVAVEEGSTMVRIGSAIFGQRNYSFA